MKLDITASRLRELLHFDPQSGFFTHIAKKRQGVIAGTVAGSVAKNGYRKHHIDGRTYSGHRLAWLYVHGEWPKGQIDHINGVRTDNRMVNLRDVTAKTNLQNRRFAVGACGLLGVHRHHKKFRASISMDGKDIILGAFYTPEEAHQAYVEAKRRLHEGCTI